jgi:hypothetical protein
MVVPTIRVSHWDRMLIKRKRERQRGSGHRQLKLNNHDWLFLTPGKSNNNGHPDMNYELKVTVNLMLEFPFICFYNLNCVVRRK